MNTIAQAGTADQTTQKSRFIAWVAHTENENQAAQFLRAIAAQHTHAHHLAYAYRVLTKDGIMERFSDAGEPSGTAGKPIVQMLEGRALINVCVGVIRYYGGINLGMGGLVRAYSGTAKLALDKAQSVPYIEMQAIDIRVTYQRVDELLRLVLQLKGCVLNKSFDDGAQFKISLPVANVSFLKARFK